MSWFDASGIASLAKTALKEAQKTIDKALDIKDEDDQTSSDYTQVSPVEESEHFFSSWGLKSPTRSMKSSNTSVEDDGNDDPALSEKASGSGLTSVMTSSLWGSFTGSFFENARTPDNEGIGNDCIPVSSQPKRSQITSIAEDIPLTESESCQHIASHTNGVLERREMRAKNSMSVKSAAEGPAVEGVDDEEVVDAFSDSRVMLVVRDEEDEEDGNDCSNDAVLPHSSVSEAVDTDSEGMVEGMNSVVTRSVGRMGLDDSKTNMEDIVSYDKFYVNKFEKRNEKSTLSIHSSMDVPSTLESTSPADASASEEVVTPSGSVSPHTTSSSSDISSPSSAPSRGVGPPSEDGTTGEKRSSESVEVLGSCEEGCATSPEGDLGTTALIESVPVHQGCSHLRSPNYNSRGFIKINAGELMSYPKSDVGAVCENQAGKSDGNKSVLPEHSDIGGSKEVNASVFTDVCTFKGLGEVDKNLGVLGRSKDGLDRVPEKTWECGTETAEAISGHGSPESVEVIPEDGDIATSPSSVEVIGGSTTSSSVTPSISASTSTRPSSSSSSISPTTPGSGSLGFAHLGIREDLAESSVIHTVVPNEGFGARSVLDPVTDGASDPVERRLDIPVDDMSPESVEVIPEEVEEEEMSSSASSTTTTTAVTVMEQQKALTGVEVRSASVLVNSSGSLERSSKEDDVEEVRCLSSLESLKGANESNGCDNGVASCNEGGINRSDLNGWNRSEQLENSSYLRTLLAEAMQEKEEGNIAAVGEERTSAGGEKGSPPQGEHSPLFSERTSDLAKVGEEGTSGQTSGDEELDTTTSSDIEIISSPNGGDSGSNKSSEPGRRRGGGTGNVKLSSSTSRGLVMIMGASPSPSTASSSSSSSSSFSMVGRGIGAHRDERQMNRMSDPSACAVLRDSYSRGEVDRGHHVTSHYSPRGLRFSSEHHLLKGQPAATTTHVEELSKRLSEISDILEARESKLVELSHANVELQEKNLDLIRRLKEAESRGEDRDGARVEFEGRLAMLDRKLQKANSENEALKAKLKEMSEDLSRMGGKELASLLKEKEDECRELREEGEKLSKQEMNLTTLIKNLRAAQRNSEKTINSLRQRLEDSENEVDRVKKSLGVREGVERAQVEAIHNLKLTLEATEREMSDLRVKVDNERRALKEEKRMLEGEKDHWSEKERELLTSIEFGRIEMERMRETLTKLQEEQTKREEALRSERMVMERRLVEVEARGEEVGAQASRATRPLLRQLESLQTISRQREAAWEAAERELLGKLSEAEGKAKIASERERAGRQRCATLSSRVSSLESQLTSLRKEVESEANKAKEDLEKKGREVSRLESERMKLEEALAESKRCNVSLEECLAVERAAVEAEKRRNALLQDQLREHLNQPKQSEPQSHQGNNPHSKGTPPSLRSSPTLSFGHASLDDSITSSAWLPLFQEDGFHDGRSVNSAFEGHAGIIATAMTTSSSSSLIESLQSQLKLRDGEVQQLQWELGRGESERSTLTAEVSSLTAKMSELEAALSLAKTDGSKLTDLQTKYDALLQMYGEKVEETEELRLDLQDIKEMYKTQIDELTKQGGEGGERDAEGTAPNT